MIKRYTNKTYLVIRPEEMHDVKIDEYFWCSRSEEKFKNFVEDSQEFFGMFERGEDCTEYKIGKADAMSVYIDLGHCITVKHKLGKYEIATNGHHRAAVAKKYGLKLLVCVL